MKTTIKIEIALTSIVICMLLMLLVVIPFDIANFYDDKDTYSKVYHLDTNDKNWEWEYLSGWLYLGGLAIIGLTIASLRLIKRDNQIIKKLNWTFILLFFGTMILRFYTWMKSGYDH